jgi:predicted dehydrogenase
MRVGIVGCGLIGRKRADAVREQDEVVGCVDVVREAAERLAEHAGSRALPLGALLDERPEVVVVAVTHDQLADVAVQALEAGAHVLVEKPAGLSVAQVDRVAHAAGAAGRLVKVGFNHRFHPGIARAVAEARSGEHGRILHARARYGHGGRPGYDREWRADPRRAGGGEIVDQGMHLIDLCHWLLGPLPLHSALLRTQFWDTTVDDNAVLVLGAAAPRTAPWALLHATWTEWKNMFSLEIYCQAAKLQVDGLVRSYGPQRLTIHRMKPELGPPDTETFDYPGEDPSWRGEWEHFATAIEGSGQELLGDLDDARYAWATVEDAYERAGYAAVRAGIG